ncbi:MAG TPA: hypothetical protein PLJ35_03225 [Anaerolineae bacterium]|nr:hypothetical protein [Anaerolineae bacterium]HOQ97814.1 hypothetical protein [Anaerolineae bacterium]
MDTLTIVLAMVGAAAVLLVAAIVADRYLGRRMERRLSGEAPKSDAADAVIQLLDRTRDMMRQTLDSAGKEKDSSS